MMVLYGWDLFPEMTPGEVPITILADPLLLKAVWFHHAG